MDIEMLSRQKNQYYSEATIKNYQKDLTDIIFDYSTSSECEIILPLINYPGYVAQNQNRQRICIKENNNHMIVIPLPKGDGSIKIHYKGLIAFKVADYISLASLLAFIFYIIRIYKRNSWNKLI
jgi:uncharacterized membrane protein YfhO